MRRTVLAAMLAGLVYCNAQAQTGPSLPSFAAAQVLTHNQSTVEITPGDNMPAVPVPAVDTQSLAPPAAPVPPLALPLPSDRRLTDWLLALLIAVLAGGNWHQWKLTRKALISANRAYVFVKECNMHPVEDGNLWIIDFLLENTGKTPARNLQAPAVWSSFPAQIPADFHLADLKATKTTKLKPAGPGQTIKLSTEELPVAALEEAARGTHRLLAWGWAEYNDVFQGKARHRTEFCFEIKVSPDFSRPGKYAIEPVLYPGHNGADEECLTRPATSG